MSTRPDILTRGELARLIPIVADTSKEQRAVSVLLAAFRGVHEFRQMMLASLGIRVGARAEVQAWTEVSFPSDAKLSKADRPDGLIVLNTGKKTWRAMIEAKIGNTEIGEEQLKTYLQIAKQNNIDAVITISNQFVALPTHHPVRVPKSLVKGVDLYHWSWMYAVTQATLLIEQNAIASMDQRFILEEAKRYLGHDSSGITRFTSMNREWSDVVGKFTSNAALNKGSEEVINTVSSWHQEQRDLCLIMSEKLSQPVRLKLSRAHAVDPIQRLKDDCEQLSKDATLRCSLEIPNAAADIDVTVGLRTRTIRSSMRLAAPQDKKRPSARVNWLARQLAKADTTDMHVKALRPGRSEDTHLPLATVLADPESLTPASATVPPSAFEVFHIADLAGRFSKPRVFIEELEKAVPFFYEQIGQKLRAWVAPPPKIRKRETDIEEEDAGPAMHTGYDSHSAHAKGDEGLAGGGESAMDLDKGLDDGVGLGRREEGSPTAWILDPEDNSDSAPSEIRDVASED